MSTVNNPHTGHEAHLPFNTGEIEITVNQPVGGEVQETAEELQDKIHATEIIPNVVKTDKKWIVTITLSEAKLFAKVTKSKKPIDWPQVRQLSEKADAAGVPMSFDIIADPVQEVPPPVPTASLATPVMEPLIAEPVVPVAQPVVLPAIPVEKEPVVVPPQAQPQRIPVPPLAKTEEKAQPKPYESAERKKVPVHLKVAAGLAFTTASVAAAAAAMLGMNRDKPNTPGIDTPNENGAAVLNLTTEEITEMTGTTDIPESGSIEIDPNLLDLDYLRANNIGGNYDFAAHVEHWKIESEVALRLYAEVVRSPGDNEDMNDYMDRPNDGIEMVWGNDWKTKIGGYTEGTHTEYNIGRVNVVENGEEGYIYYGFSRDFGAIDGSKVMPGSVGMAYEMGFASNNEPDVAERMKTEFVMGHMMPSDDSDRIASRER
jgi:hypothetical protein